VLLSAESINMALLTEGGLIGRWRPQNLVVGLKLFLGDVEYRAQEILEIGQDVERRIRELAARKNSDDVKNESP